MSLPNHILLLHHLPVHPFPDFINISGPFPLPIQTRHLYLSCKSLPGQYPQVLCSAVLLPLAPCKPQPWINRTMTSSLLKPDGWMLLVSIYGLLPRQSPTYCLEIRCSPKVTLPLPDLNCRSNLLVLPMCSSRFYQTTSPSISQRWQKPLSLAYKPSY